MQVPWNQYPRALLKILLVVPLRLIMTRRCTGKVTNNQYLPFPQWFFDRKCWAKHSNSGEVLKPVYFLSTAMNDKVEQMNKCTSEYIFLIYQGTECPQWYNTSLVRILSRPISEASTSKATVKETQRDSVRKHRGQRKTTKNLSVRFSSLGHFQRMELSTLPFSWNEWWASQLEITFLLSLHRPDLVRSPQIPRRRLSVEVRPREHGRGSTPSLLTEEYLCFSKFGEAALNQTSHAWYRCANFSWKLSPFATMPWQTSIEKRPHTTANTGCTRWSLLRKGIWIFWTWTSASY